MTVYETTGFPNPARVRAALAAKGAVEQVTFIEVDVMAKEHRTPEFYLINPLGTVPVLRTPEGIYLTDSTVIIEYLDNILPGPNLSGTTPLERGIIHMMQRRAEVMVMDAVAAYFHHATTGLGPELETAPCQPWGELQKLKAQAGLVYFNQHLQDQAFVAADRLTMADITLFYGLAFADFSGLEIPAHLRHLAAWRERMAQRPEFNG
ncbi:glutathione S-transferase family protein [Shewanella sp. NIFS-20-20]|uniref:glutathione S-transferase family protein n=1 Tax=Shewanella sp. NIFS-20-20 TaxID=2853806 RepID=UPI001C4712F0|nr:glutathione S-transferase [Shewanella sp. NIFS-20-20]MBV7316372.1 glutathione S-transferase [Shewanella sp. NIFS-20-20]